MCELNPILGRLGRVYELYYDGSSCDNISASWKEVSTNNRFQNTTLARRLTSDNYNLGHFNSEWHLCSVENFLKLINYRN